MAVLHPRANLTHKFAAAAAKAAAAAAAATAAAKISARRRHGKKKKKIFTKTWKPQKLQKTSIKSIKNDKNIDFGGARNKRTSPSNSTRKTTYIDLFSFLYVRTSAKICSYTSVNVGIRPPMFAYVHMSFVTLFLHMGVVCFFFRYCSFRFVIQIKRKLKRKRNQKRNG